MPNRTKHAIDLDQVRLDYSAFSELLELMRSASAEWRAAGCEPQHLPTLENIQGRADEHGTLVIEIPRPEAAPFRLSVPSDSWMGIACDADADDESEFLPAGERAIIANSATSDAAEGEASWDRATHFAVIADKSVEGVNAVMRLARSFDLPIAGNWEDQAFDYVVLVASKTVPGFQMFLCEDRQHLVRDVIADVMFGIKQAGGYCLFMLALQEEEAVEVQRELEAAESAWMTKH